MFQGVPLFIFIIVVLFVCGCTGQDVLPQNTQVDPMWYNISCPPITDMKNGHPACSDGKCRLTCNEGFLLAGIGELKCENGKWNPPVPECFPAQNTQVDPMWYNISCPPITDIKNGLVACTTGSCKFTCDIGFALDGIRRLVCENGKWNPPVPECVRNNSQNEGFTAMRNLCSNITTINHGSVNCSPESCGITCDQGFNLVGVGTINCVNGNWNPPIPSCVQADCPPLEIPDDNVIPYGPCRKGALVGETCRFVCKGDLRLEGAGEINCTNALKWNGPAPRCIKESCPALQVPENLSWEGACIDGGVGKNCRFYCKDNFILEGKNEIFCRATFQWSDAVPICKKSSEEKYCPPIEIRDDVIPEGPCKKLQVGEKCILKCKYTAGIKEFICNSTLQWTDGGTLICKNSKEDYCPPIAVDDSVLTEGPCKQAHAGEKCSLKCKNTKDSKVLTCTSTLQWSEGTLICKNTKEQYCPPVAIADYVIPIGPCKKARVGEKCILKCKYAEGRKELSCNTDLQWSGGTLFCKKSYAKYCPSLHIPYDVMSDGICNNAKSGEMCRFYCENNKFTLQGKEVLMCTATLQWSGVVPLCVKSKFIPWRDNWDKPHRRRERTRYVEAKESCPALQKPAHMKWDGPCTHALAGEKCQFECMDNFRLEGPTELTCTMSLHWNDLPPLCKRM